VAQQTRLRWVLKSNVTQNGFELIHIQESKTMSKATSTFHLLCRATAIAAVLGAGVAVMGAQAPQSAVPAQSSLNLQAPAVSTSSDALSSSSSDENAATPATEASVTPMAPNFAEMMQYGGGQRQRYGRPRYRGANTNADGSSKYIFFGGAGFQQPIGNTFHYLTPSYGFQVGGGRQFNKHFAVPIQFDYDHFGFAGQTLGNQTNIYNSNNVFGAGAVSGLDGTSHVWSFTLDPTYTLYAGEGLGAYVVGGVGFYHKTANFTIPAEGEYCDPYYGCYTYEANETIDKYTANAPGFSGGFGLTYKFSRFSNERFYGEVRYVFVDNSHRPGFTVANEASITATSTNLYPANSNRTTYIPVKFGIRF
jgi:hypothetical protein